MNFFTSLFKLLFKTKPAIDDPSNPDNWTGHVYGEHPFGDNSSNRHLFEQQEMFEEPYVIEVENTTDEIQNAIILGYANYSTEPNYGNAEGVTVKNKDGSYYALLNEFDGGVGIGKIDVMADLKSYYEAFSSIDKTVILYSCRTEVRGLRTHKPIKIQQSVLQFNTDRISKEVDLFFSGNDHLEIKVPAKTKIILSLFPYL